MNNETTGTVISVHKQWWLKVNTKPVRRHSFDGAVFPHIIIVEYTVDGRQYTKKKWIRAGLPAPAVGSTVTVLYEKDKPSHVKVI